MGTEGRDAPDIEPLDDAIRFVLEAAGIGWWHLDMTTNTTTRSLLHDEVFGYTEMLPSWSYDDYIAHVHPDDRAMVKESFATALAGGEAYAVDVRVVWPDGSVHWLFTRGRFLLDSDGTPLRVAGMVTDITDRKLKQISEAEGRATAAEAQAETLALLETLLESAPVGFAFMDRDYRFARINDALAEMNGLPASEHLGRLVSDVVPELWPQLEAIYEGVLGAGEAVRGLEISGVTDAQPGVQRHWVVSFYPVRAQHGGDVLGIGVVASEVTESVQLEAHLRQSQKLEAVGLLAGGVAHDFDNALAAIVLTAELAQRKPVVGDVDNHLDSILKVARSANRLTRQLLLFSRQEPTRSTVVDVLSRIEEVVAFLGAGLGEHIRVELDLQPVPFVRMDPGQLDQILVNLAINARDAMSGGGTLSVGARDAVITDPPLGLPPGRYVDLQVVDTGHGMTEEVLERAFEPFFTTKSAQGGTGLGLATVYGMVQSAHGHVSIESTLGEGTTVRVLLPETLERPAEPAAVGALPSGRGQRVLVVEDQVDLRGSVVRVLTDAGYLVTSGSADDVLVDDGHDGPRRPDLLLTDVVMPGVSGPRLAHLLTTRWPDLRVLYMSGYTDGMLAHHGVDSDTVRLLRKPFATEELLRAVADALRA
ncbi:PAS domain-containing protein [Nocardioides sp. HDW12B]|uniref:PAS domain-containing hybrid sensor histidine kinase/response regulator n=1 Tax=Nocardioides sp. HDW12B TaxID=2714939 RepID=UPI00140DC883|nr:PAS domain-containing protein [Nocardioides sp. HDW12B]QIK68097.1 PAS domain-containing protein [Nocardioides sp. HDW12B]